MCKRYSLKKKKKLWEERKKLGIYNEEGERRGVRDRKPAAGDCKRNKLTQTMIYEYLCDTLQA